MYAFIIISFALFGLPLVGINFSIYYVEQKWSENEKELNVFLFRRGIKKNKKLRPCKQYVSTLIGEVNREYQVFNIFSEVIRVRLI